MFVFSERRRTVSVRAGAGIDVVQCNKEYHLAQSILLVSVASASRQTRVTKQKQQGTALTLRIDVQYWLATDKRQAGAEASKSN